MLPPIFDSIADHRVTGRCTYVLSELLTIALLTYLSNGEDYVDMSDFADERARDFGLYCTMTHLRLQILLNV